MCGGSWSFRAYGGLPRGCARFLASAGHLFNRVLAAWHTHAKEHSAQAVKPDVCRCAACKKKDISSTTNSTN